MKCFVQPTIPSTSPINRVKINICHCATRSYCSIYFNNSCFDLAGFISGSLEVANTSAFLGGGLTSSSSPFDKFLTQSATGLFFLVL